MYKGPNVQNYEMEDKKLASGGCDIYSSRRNNVASKCDFLGRKKPSFVTPFQRILLRVGILLQGYVEEEGVGAGGGQKPEGRDGGIKNKRRGKSFRRRESERNARRAK